MVLGACRAVTQGVLRYSVSELFTSAADAIAIEELADTGSGQTMLCNTAGATCLTHRTGLKLARSA